MYKGTQWVGYEDEKSIKIKMDWIKSKGYAGAMNWAIDMDDFHGLCGEPHALMKILWNSMVGYDVPKPTHETTPQPEWAMPKSTSPNTNEMAPIPTRKTTVASATRTTIRTSMRPSTAAPAPAEESDEIEDSEEEEEEEANEIVSTNNDVEAPPKPVVKPPTTAAPTPRPTTAAAPAVEEEESVEYYDDDEEEVPDCSTGQEYLPSTQCNVYYHCNYNDPVKFECKEGLIYNTKEHICDWPSNADREECRGPNA